MGADNAHKADNAEEGYAHCRDDRSQQHGRKAQPVHRHAHALGCGVPAQEGVELPTHKSKKHKSRQHCDRHDAVCAVGGTAQVAEGPDHGGGKADIGCIELQDRSRRRPHRADSDTGQHHHARLESPQTAEAEDQQDRDGGKQERHQGRGIGISAHGIARQVVSRVQKAAGKGDDGKIRAEHRRVGHAQRGGRGHGVIEVGLHDEAGDRQARPGDDGRQHARNADVPDNAHLSSTALFCKGRKTLRKTHMRRTHEQAYKGQHDHRHSEQNQCRSVSSSVFGQIRLHTHENMISPRDRLHKPPGGI